MTGVQTCALPIYDFFLDMIFIFFNNLGDCFFFGCLSLFCFNWLSFFNKSI